MLKQRRDAAVHLAGKLFAAEQALDEAICKMGELIGYMPTARTSARLSAVVGQDAISEASETLSAMIGARAHLVATHKRLADVRDQIGLRELSMGSTDMKPPALVTATDANIVKMVGDAA